MKEITKVYNVYKLEELPKEAREKAHEEWEKNNDYFFLSDCMNEELHRLLEENNIKDVYGEYDKVKQERPKGKARVYYSLSYSQGDGAMFEGTFTFTHEGKEYRAKVKHAGHYYHSNSKDITIYDSEDEEIYEGVICDYFEKIYQDICYYLKKYGYDFIEYEDSMEAFQNDCDANEYTFTIDGIMDNSQ